MSAIPRNHPWKVGAEPQHDHRHDAGLEAVTAAQCVAGRRSNQSSTGDAT
jgi:hypothetical protein